MVANNVKKKTYILGIYLFILVFCISASPTFAQTEVNIESLNSSLFPFIYSHVSVKSNGISIYDLTKDDFQVFENNNLQTEYFEVTPPETGGGVRLADIVFLIDVSGSMGGEIADVRNNVNNFANALAASNIDFRLGLVRFGNSSGANPYLFNNGNLTGDVSTFQSFVNTLYASGGYEPGFLAIRQAITGFNFRPGAQKVFLIITDEDSDDRNKQQTINMLLANSITVHSAVDCNSGYSRSDYCDDTSIRGITGGSLFGVRSSYNAVLDTIVETTSNTYVVRYKSSNHNLDGTLRNVEIFGTITGDTDSDIATYVPGSAPKIALTAEAESLLINPPVEGITLTISAYITDNIPPNITSAKLYYKSENASNFYSVDMTNTSENIWQADIQGSSVEYPGVKFYITASDGQTTSSLPETEPSDRPINLAVLPNELPVITHTPPIVAVIDQPVEIVAEVSDATYSINTIVLRYRKKGEINYEEIGLSVGMQSFEFREEIPANTITSDGVEYYIEAKDNLGCYSYSGTRNKPHFIRAGRLIDTNFTFHRDNYSFTNDENFVDLAFYNALKIELEDILFPSISNVIINKLWGSIAACGGYCWGMSETSIMYYLFPDLKPIRDKFVYNYTAEEAMAAIHNYHAGQIYPLLHDLVSLHWEKSFGSANQKNDYDLMKSNIQKGVPVVVSLFSDCGGHAVVAYKIIETDEFLYTFLYDPNYLNVVERHIAFTVVDQNTYVPHYLINDKCATNFLHAWRPDESAISIMPDLRRMLSDVIKELVTSLYGDTRGFFRLSCPADAVLTDQFGRRIGVVNGITINEIPSAEIMSAGEIEIYEIPLDLNYHVEIIGTGSGTGKVDIISPILGLYQMRNVSYSNIPLLEGSKIVFRFDASGSEELMIDQDGDGHIDTTQPLSSDESFAIDFPDTDNDNVIDIVDNCPNISNPDQADSDGDGVGDVCENMPPIADAGQDQIVAVSFDCMATVTLDGSSSSNPNGDELTYLWIWESGSATGVNPTILLPLGTTTITLVVNDGVLDSEPDTVDISVADTTSPAVAINVPNSGDALQDGITLMAEATDACEVNEVYFCIREPGEANGISIGYEDLAATLNESTGAWECGFDATQLQDGYYVVIAKAVDTNGNEGWSTPVPISIRNWAVIELLPNTANNKAGRTMPVKFALRIAAAVDPAQPFVYNEELEIRIYDASEPDTILLQTSLYGDTSKDYRIDNAGELYITNFKTSKTPAEYIVEIWRMSKDFKVGDFTFKTVK